MLRKLPWLIAALTLPLHAEIHVSTGFEGGNAEVVSLDQATKTLRIMPALHEDRGWPCWWYFKLDGLTTGDEFTLEVQAQTKPFREKTVLSATWCQPKHAWISGDGETWTPSDKGTPGADKTMIYKIKAAAAQMSVAWGPPFVPADAEKLLAGLAEKLPGSKRFELAKTRGGRPVQGIRIGDEDAPHQVWVGARHHAWEAGGSQVGRGFISWYAGDEAKALRAKTCCARKPACTTSRSWTWTTPPSARVARMRSRATTIATGPPSRSIPRSPPRSA